MVRPLTENLSFMMTPAPRKPIPGLPLTARKRVELSLLYGLPFYPLVSMGLGGRWLIIDDFLNIQSADGTDRVFPGAFVAETADRGGLIAGQRRFDTGLTRRLGDTALVIGR